jgi:hypothetical protein
MSGRARGLPKPQLCNAGQRLRMIVIAEMRLADEVDAAQERGEVAKAGGDPIARKSGNGAAPVNLPDLGVSSQRLSEWREVRDAGPEVVEQAIMRSRSHTPTAIDESSDAQRESHKRTSSQGTTAGYAATSSRAPARAPGGKGLSRGLALARNRRSPSEARSHL